jgi:Tfp pilus assembly protein PilX
MEQRRNEKGFALVAALMANLILLAVGIVALNLSTGDIRTSMRSLGDKKAVNAAETAVHRLAMDFIDDSPTGISNLQGKIYNDFSADAGTKATVGTIVKNPKGVTAPSLPGYQTGGNVTWSQEVYEATVRGENTVHKTSVTVVAGFGHGPTPGSGTTQY